MQLQQKPVVWEKLLNRTKQHVQWVNSAWTQMLHTLTLDTCSLCLWAMHIEEKL